MLRTNKLECLSPTFSQSIQKMLELTELKNFKSLPTNIMLGSNCLPWANSLAYISEALVPKKKFDNIDARCLCYQTFFLLYHRSSKQISWSVWIKLFLQSIQEMLELTQLDKFEFQSLTANIIQGKLSSSFFLTHSRKEKV